MKEAEKEKMMAAIQKLQSELKTDIEPSWARFGREVGEGIWKEIQKVMAI